MSHTYNLRSGVVHVRTHARERGSHAPHLYPAVAKSELGYYESKTEEEDYNALDDVVSDEEQDVGQYYCDETDFTRHASTSKIPRLSACVKSARHKTANPKDPLTMVAEVPSPNIRPLLDKTNRHSRQQAAKASRRRLPDLILLSDKTGKTPSRSGVKASSPAVPDPSLSINRTNSTPLAPATKVSSLAVPIPLPLSNKKNTTPPPDREDGSPVCNHMATVSVRTQPGGLLTPISSPSPEYHSDIESTAIHGSDDAEQEVADATSAHENKDATREPREERSQDTIQFSMGRLYSEPWLAAEGISTSQLTTFDTGSQVAIQDVQLGLDSTEPLHLFHFAPETLLHVLSYLSLGEILRVRTVHINLQRLIDNKSNFSLLAYKPNFIASMLDKLVSLGSYNILHFDYLQILAELVARGGLWLTKDPYILTIHIMMDLFMRRTPASGTAPRNVTWNAFWRLGYNIWQVHIQHHLPHQRLRCMNWVPCVDCSDFVRRIYDIALDVFGITGERLIVWYKELTETPGGYFRGLPGPPLANEAMRWGGPVIPRFCLTGLYSFDFEVSMRPSCHELMNQYRPPVVANASKRLADMLGISELPTQFEAYGKLYQDGYAFAWCAHTKGVFNKIKDALAREDGRYLTLLDKAILRDDLYLA